MMSSKMFVSFLSCQRRSNYAVSNVLAGTLWFTRFLIVKSQSDLPRANSPTVPGYKFFRPNARQTGGLKIRGLTLPDVT